MRTTEREIGRRTLITVYLEKPEDLEKYYDDYGPGSVMYSYNDVDVRCVTEYEPENIVSLLNIN